MYGDPKKYFSLRATFGTFGHALKILEFPPKKCGMNPIVDTENMVSKSQGPKNWARIFHPSLYQEVLKFNISGG